MRDLKINCPHCKQPLEVPEEMLGTIAECPSCNNQIQLPFPQSYTKPQPIIIQKAHKNVISTGNAPTRDHQSATRSCPFCGEEILAVAIKCKHCGSSLTPIKNEKNKGKIGGIGWALILVPPLTGMLPLLFVPNQFITRMLVSYSFVLFSTILISFEAYKVGAGAEQDRNPNGSRREGPVLWFVTGLLLWGIVYPWWMARRAKYGLRNLCALAIFIVVICWVMSSMLFLGQGENLANMVGITTQQESLTAPMENDAITAGEKNYVELLVIRGACYWLSKEQVMETFKKLKRHFGDNAIVMMEDYIEIVNGIPHLANKDYGELSQGDVYNLMANHKFSSFKELRESGVFITRIQQPTVSNKHMQPNVVQHTESDKPTPETAEATRLVKKHYENKEYAKAFEAARNADVEDAAIQCILGRMYLDGEGVSKDETEAVKWFSKAAQQGNADAQNKLGYCYETGKGSTESATDAVKWFRKAADQGLAKAQYNMGYCYEKGKGVPEDWVEAVQWYRKAAEQEHVDAQFKLGCCYAFGNGVVKDEAEAVKWFLKAAELGNATAQYNLGLYYENGQGIAKNETEAVKWYRKGAAQGYANAQSKLACLYVSGKGVIADESEAIKWCRKAAEQGLAEAQHNLGLFYLWGRAVPKDIPEAVKLFRKAAEQGCVDAQFTLGVLYSDGQGVTKDISEAVKWFRKAAQQGHVKAQEALKLLGLRVEDGP